MGKRRIAVLGSTGSIGRQTLEVIGEHPDLFEVELLTANTNGESLIAQALEFDAGCVVIRDEDKYKEVADALQPYGIRVYAGMDSICALASGDNIDIVVAAMVGFSGLKPVVAALRAGKTVALANKETLVAAGELVLGIAAQGSGSILPIDSEHSAVFQCLQAAGGAEVERIHLTASGGPFRTWSKERIAAASKEEALRHPQWNMGRKVTVDSATMMNKGLEIIEAHWLFSLEPERINVVVHPESVIHSMVEFKDGAVVALMSKPDMRIPIQYALSWPDRLPLGAEKLDFAKLGSLNFHDPDREKFPALGIAEQALARGGNIPCAMNAANEVAVDAFLRDEIGFYDITDTIGECITRTEFVVRPNLDEIFETHQDILRLAEEMVSRKTAKKHRILGGNGDEKRV